MNTLTGAGVLLFAATATLVGLLVIWGGGGVVVADGSTPTDSPTLIPPEAAMLTGSPSYRNSMA